MKGCKWLLAASVLIAVGAATSGDTVVAATPRKQRADRYAHLHFPADPREFRGWRHNGRNAPVWDLHPELPRDVFTFARLRFPCRPGGRWTADYPEAELNFSFRLHQLTSFQVNPYPVIIDLDEKQLRQHPFVFISEPENMQISKGQARLLRDYMLNGGFVLMDDFWGGDEWNAFAPTLKMIWPDREHVELKHDHPIFHCVFNLSAPPQVHSNVFWAEMKLHGRTRITNEPRPDAAVPSFRAIYDDRGRMAMLICLNNDLGDGWEQEAFDPEYFREVSEKHAYPLGINIVVYALTH